MWRVGVCRDEASLAFCRWVGGGGVSGTSISQSRSRHFGARFFRAGWQVILFNSIPLSFLSAYVRPTVLVSFLGRGGIFYFCFCWVFVCVCLTPPSRKALWFYKKCQASRFNVEEFSRCQCAGPDLCFMIRA